MCAKPIYINHIWVDCGKCAACRKKRSRDWTIRLLHEYMYCRSAVFVTLTYDNEHLPDNFSLQYSDVQLMLKRLRKNSGKDIKFFCAGEYGPKTQRPHYHIILFGLDYYTAKKYFPDDRCSSTEIMDHAVWTLGHVDVGYSFNDKTCAYVAQYALKKLSNAEYKGHRFPPFLRCSKGLGKRYALDHTQCLMTQGYISWNEHRYGIPRYYFKVWDVDRAMYFKDQLNQFSKKLVSAAEANGISVFRDLTSDVDYCHSVVKQAYTEGRYIVLDGVIRYVTEDFHQFVWSIRVQEDRINKARLLKHRRDKV